MPRIALAVFLALTCSSCASTSATKKDTVPEPVAQEEPAQEEPAQEAPAAEATKNLNLADIPFAPFNPKQPEGVHVYAISGNPSAGAFNAIVRFPPGYRTPLHAHTATYTGVAMSEGLVHGSTEEATEALPRWSNWVQPAGEAHVDACQGEEPCYLLAFFDGAVDMVPADAPAAEPTVQINRGDQLEWVPVKGGVMMSLIHGNPKEGAFHTLFQFPAGMSTNVHTHSAGFTGALRSRRRRTGFSPPA